MNKLLNTTGFDSMSEDYAPYIMIIFFCSLWSGLVLCYPST